MDYSSSDFVILTLLAILNFGVALFAAYRALLTSRTPQGTMGWILLILLLPIFGSLLYLLFGHADYQSFERERQKTEDTLYHKPDALQATGRLAPFARLARMPVTEGNALTLLIDGEDTYQTLRDRIASAQNYVAVQFYTIQNDEVGLALRDCLIERARAGVSVWVLHDELPFFGLPRGFKTALTEAGVKLARPKGPRRLLGPFQLNYRNHRKLVIVDGDMALTGGLNVGREYLGRDKAIGPWRDTFVELTGPVVAQFVVHFASDWKWATDEDLMDHMPSDPAPTGPSKAVALAPSPADDHAIGNLYFLALAHAAKKRLWISSPYFVPDSDVISALKFAALRGVDVKVLVPAIADHYLTYFAAMAYFDDLRSAGGEVWTYNPAFPHQKVALVDDDLVSVGSINLDIRSGLLNFEITVVAEGPEAAQPVIDMLENDFANATRVDFDLVDRPFFVRTAARVARMFAPLL